MPTTCTHIAGLATELQLPEKGVLSRTLLNDEKVKAVIFDFAQGEELSEHTASKPAVLHFLQGEALLTLSDDILKAKTGTWVHMPTGQRHIKPRTNVATGKNEASLLKDLRKTCATYYDAHVP